MDIQLARGRSPGETAGDAPARTAPQPGTPAEVAEFVVGAAVWSPSVHNTQPWRFRAEPGEISLYADTDRRLAIADPDGREMMISCGAALFTTRLALRYLGYVPVATILPDPDRPVLIARVSWQEQAPAADYERDLYHQIAARRTHRGGFDAGQLPPALLAALSQDAARHGAMLRVVTDDKQLAAIAAIVDAAENVLRLDGPRARETARWAPPPGSSRRDGVPHTSYPARPEHTDPQFPGRDFARGQGWGHPPASSAPLLRSAGVVSILTTAGDRPADWVNAGQALQRVLLSAGICGAAAALHSQPLELAQLRDLIRVQFCDRAHPQMLLRLGTTGQAAVSVRRPVDEVLL